MNTAKRTRRDFIKTAGGLGGISLLAPGIARGQALTSLPSGYRFYRVLRANQGASSELFTNIGAMSGAVMMASPLSGSGKGYIYLHGQVGANPALFRIDIDYDADPPKVTYAFSQAVETLPLNVSGASLTIQHLSVGASNALGEYITAIQPAGPQTPTTAPGLFLYTPTAPVSSWRRLITFADQAPDGSYYGGDFGDVALDDEENLLFVSATTHAPGSAESGFSGSQSLISTAVSSGASSRVVLRTGDLLPYAPAAIRSVGLIDLAANNAFAAQVTANNLSNSARPGTALIAGNTQRGLAEHRLVAASPSVVSPQAASLLNIASGDTLLGPRVDPRQDVGFVTHLGSFARSEGGDDIQELGYFARGVLPLGRTQPSVANDEVVSYNAPCISYTGLLYETELLGDGTNQLRVSDGVNSDVLLRSGDRLPGVFPNGDLPITEIFFGQHATQVDRFGRLAFTAEFQLSSDPAALQDPNNYITALVVGIPL